MSESVDMKGKVCIVTGANSGIGLETAAGLASMGATVVMACRNPDTGQRALDEVRERTGSDALHLLQLDLTSQQSIREFANSFMQQFDRLDVLINNAAVVPVKRRETADGHEMQFGVNHLGPFLLTNLLLDRLKASAPSRIVNVASVVHYKAELDLDELQSTKDYSAITVYGQTKLENVLFTYELARRFEGTGVTANCLHPGVVRTGITRDMPFFLQPLVKLAGLFMLSPSKGAATSLHVATSPELEGVTGKYFRECRESRSSPLSHDEEMAKKLWAVSAELTGLPA